MTEPIRVLHVLGGLSIGGAESRIMDLYRNMDRKKIQFDFLIHTTEKQHFEEEITKLGGKIYRVPRFKVYNWFSYEKALKQFFSHHKEFRAVHGHMTSTASIYLPIAKKAGIPITIAHSRSAGVDGGIKGVATKILRRSLKHKTDYCLACSKEAGEAVFGKKWVEQGKVQVIPNAIETEKYVYDIKVREDMRESLGLAGKLVIGHVGSFRTPKNHVFLLDVFAEIYKRNPAARLVLVGEGPLMPEIKEKAKQLGLSEVVLFTGNQSKVSDYYQTFDILIFPSLYEGLPGTVVEAQVSGLKCLISDAITKEVDITELVYRMSLADTAEEWTIAAMQMLPYERKSHLEEVNAAGFSIKEQAKRYEELYGLCR